MEKKTGRYQSATGAFGQVLCASPDYPVDFLVTKQPWAESVQEMSVDMSKPSQPTTPLTPARKTAYGLAIVAGLLTSATQFVTYPSALLIALLQIMVSVLCLLLCLREPFDGPGRFSPVFIAAIALALSFFVVPG